MPEIRPRRRAIWLLTFVALVASFAFLMVRLVGSSDGAAVAFYADAWSGAGVQVRVPPGSSTGLHSGDIVMPRASRNSPPISRK